MSPALTGGFFTTSTPREVPHSHVVDLLKSTLGLPDGPVVRALPSNTEDVDSVPSWGSEIPHAS